MNTKANSKWRLTKMKPAMLLTCLVIFTIDLIPQARANTPPIVFQITASDGASSDHFGHSVDISGATSEGARFGQLKHRLSQVGEDLGVHVVAMHDDILTAMHSV